MIVPLRDTLKADDERAERANDELWAESDRIEHEFETERARSTWPEVAGPLSAVVTSVRAAGNWSAVSFSRGGRHGVRTGWLTGFGPSTDLYPSEYLVTEVKNTMCVAIVPRPPEELESLVGGQVTLRKP